MKSTIIAVLVAILLIGGAVYLTRGNSGVQYGDEPTAENVKIENGIQVVNINAKGGFFPRTSLAKAGVETVLKINTSGTFDCSSVVRIPSLGVSKNLPATGVTEISLGKQSAGDLYGTCGMGMYPFTIKFI